MRGLGNRARGQPVWRLVLGVSAAFFIVLWLLSSPSSSGGGGVRTLAGEIRGSAVVPGAEVGKYAANGASQPQVYFANGTVNKELLIKLVKKVGCLFPFCCFL